MANDNILVVVNTHTFVLQKVGMKPLFQGAMCSTVNGYHFHTEFDLFSKNQVGKSTPACMIQNNLCALNPLSLHNDRQGI